MPLLSAPGRHGLRGVVDSLFRAPSVRGTAGRVGLEAEVIPIRAGDGSSVLPSTPCGTLPVLRGMARRLGWKEEPTPGGIPRFVLGAAGVLSFEPGGQIEFASSPMPSLDALDGEVRRFFDALTRAMEREGIRLVARGVDPANPLAAAQLVLGGDRYPRQRAHYDRRGESGRRMMLQSAALHLNLDFGADPAASWSVANLTAPHLIALFANSPRRCGANVPHRSHRAALWRSLDPTRTGAFPRSEDPAGSYLEFALGAESFLLGEPGAPSEPYERWHARGASESAFEQHLSTLFPEVRPRGYLEIRSVDALPARWCVVPAAVASVLIGVPETRDRVLRDLPPPSTDRLERAGRLGLADPELSAESRWLCERVAEGMAGLGPDFMGAAVRARVEAFLDTFTSRGLDPGSAEDDFVST